MQYISSKLIHLDLDDFIGSRNGIYTHASSHGRAWERPASLELINPALVPRSPLLGPVLNLPIPDNELTRSFDA